MVHDQDQGVFGDIGVSPEHAHHVVGVAEDTGRRADLLAAGACVAVPDVGHLLSGVISSEKQGLPHQNQRPIQFNSSAGKQPDGGV